MSEPNVSNPDDPFARMAEALKEQSPAGGHKRPKAKGAPFTNVTPFLPPLARAVTPKPVAPPSPITVAIPRPSDLPQLPSVIVAEDGPEQHRSFIVDDPTYVPPRRRNSDEPTVARGSHMPPESFRKGPILGLLAVSVMVFAVAIAAFWASNRPMSAPLVHHHATH